MLVLRPTSGLAIRFHLPKQMNIYSQVKHDRKALRTRCEYACPERWALAERAKKPVGDFGALNIISNASSFALSRFRR